MRLLRGRRGILWSIVLGLGWPASEGDAAGADRASAESPVWMGSGSCAATACHGGRREPLALKGSEYTFSEAYDPHAKAFSVLYDDRSRRIERNYRRLADVELARPFEDEACLRCHVHQGYDAKAPWTHAAGFAEADGAGCEGCHGAAGRWLVPHVEIRWKSLSDRQKSDVFGMRPTKDLLARGQACAECHVGLGSTDVNHDLIAAGHPRLSFEFGSHSSKLPKHWRVEDDRARHPDYEAKLWALGQLLEARASLDLLESRALRSLPEDSTSPWPEFAEYSCFSCHHTLVQKGWASANVSDAPRPGSLQWGTWSSPMMGHLPSWVSGPLGADTNLMLEPLRTIMVGRDPDPGDVARRAGEASREIGRVAEALNRGQVSVTDIRTMLGTFRLEDPSTALDWDRAARQYLALVALDLAASSFDPRFSDPSIRDALTRLKRDLDLPTQVDGVGKRSTFDSPYRLDLERIRGDLRAVQAALPAR